MKTQIFITIFISLLSLQSKADWSWNIGYHNPHTATVGVNFLHLWTDWAVELGLGYIQAQSGDQTTGLTLGGGVNLKYFFLHNVFRPYLQGGYGMSSGVSNKGAGVGIAGGFIGGGIFIWSNDFHIYLSYDLAEGGGSFYQVGLGFPL